MCTYIWSNRIIVCRSSPRLLSPADIWSPEEKGGIFSNDRERSERARSRPAADLINCSFGHGRLWLLEKKSSLARARACPHFRADSRARGYAHTVTMNNAFRPGLEAHRCNSTYVACVHAAVMYINRCVRECIRALHTWTTHTRVYYSRVREWAKETACTHPRALRGKSSHNQHTICLQHRGIHTRWPVKKEKTLRLLNIQSSSSIEDFYYTDRTSDELRPRAISRIFVIKCHREILSCNFNLIYN